MALALDLRPDNPDLAGLTTTAVYLVVFGFVFVESGLLVGFLLPGDTILFGAGLLAASDRSDVSLAVLLIGVLIAAVSGDSVGYAIGSRLGRPWLDRRMTAGRLDPRHLARADAFYDRFGPLAVVAARWVPWLRTVVPILAGTSRLPYRRFLPANVLGALLWGAGLLVLGYYAAADPGLRTAAYVVAGVFVVGSVVAAVAGMVTWARTRSPRGR